MAPVVQLVRHRQPGRAGADDGHLFPSPQLGRRRLHQAVVVGVFDQGQLVLPDGNRIPVGTADAGRLAEPGTDPPGELRESCWSCADGSPRAPSCPGRSYRSTPGSGCGGGSRYSCRPVPHRTDRRVRRSPCSVRPAQSAPPREHRWNSSKFLIRCSGSTAGFSWRSKSINPVGFPIIHPPLSDSGWRRRPLPPPARG